MSRPSRSWPNGCASEGGRRFSARLVRVGSKRETHGPAIARAKNAATIPSPRRAETVMLRRSPEPHAGVEAAVREVGHQVRRDVSAGDDEHASLNERIIAAVDRLERQPPDPWPG